MLREVSLLICVGSQNPAGKETFSLAGEAPVAFSSTACEATAFMERKMAFALQK